MQDERMSNIEKLRRNWPRARALLPRRKKKRIGEDDTCARQKKMDGE